MLSSSDNNNHTASSPSNSLCEGSVSPSSIHSHSQPSTRELNESSQHSLKNDTSSDDPTDFSTLQAGGAGGQDQVSAISSNIEMHPQNDSLSTVKGSNHQQFIKRPLNAYMIWTRQERRKILTGDPKLKMNEVSKAIQMGEKWKKMSSEDKQPFFEMARKFAMEHKKALQDHPELAYAPSKKKGHKNSAANVAEQKIQAAAAAKTTAEQNQKNSSYTPNMSPRSNTPRQLLASTATGFQQFVPFQNALNSGNLQIAQVLGVRPSAVMGSNPYGLQMSTPTSTSAAGSILVQPQQQQTAFASPQLQAQQRIANNPLGVAAGVSGSTLDFYYTSLCQPAFPSISETPVNALNMYPPQYILEQYNQQFNQQQQQGNTGAAPNAGAAPHF